MGVSNLEESVVRSVLDALAVAYYTSIELYPACTIVSKSARYPRSRGIVDLDAPRLARARRIYIAKALHPSMIVYRSES